VRSKAQARVLAALTAIITAMPFPVLGIDSDNGTEFINHQLLRFCVERKITFTRSRPGHKNDGAHVEQKNWTVVRHAVGYARYDTAGELTVLNQLYQLLRLETNFFTPQQKLKSKTRDGAKITKRYGRTDCARIDHMTPAPEHHALATDPAQASGYDSFAEAYSAENETSLNNAYYERPATLALAGDVAGRRILDAGCGSGPLFAALRDRGAIVTGFDKSAGMLELARRRLGADADLRVADLADALPYSDDSFDDVIASLVLHYLQDWGPTLAELRRVLKTGGRLIASVGHPTAEYVIERLSGHRPDYFATYNKTEEWTLSGQATEVSFWNRPLHAMTDALPQPASGSPSSANPNPHRPPVSCSPTTST